MIRPLSAALRHYSFIIVLLLIAGCATYYQKNLVFQQLYTQGQIEEASQQLDKNKKLAKGNTKLLYYLQKGSVLQLLGHYEESNQFFEEAYYFTEDYRKNYSLEALSLITNQTVKPYVGEDHELVLIHYFKALNFLHLNQLEQALVECRRINIKLNELNDRYGDKKNRYDVDPFAHNLMGIVYEASGEINDAFIAYRNAYQAYQEAYEFLGVEVPNQLKKDLIRMAHLNGFNQEKEQYESLFEMKYEPKKTDDGELVFFWHNGLGPIKSEWTVNFFVVKGQGGIVNFENKEMGMNFPFPAPRDDDGNTQLGDLRIVRVAFPKYVDRTPYFYEAQLNTNGAQYTLEKAHDISKVAFTTLEDRMVRELANSLLRLAIKQAAELATREENENLGALISIVNAVTEKADTRNWQTIPHDVHYVRVPLKSGPNEISLVAKSNTNQQEQYKISVEGGKGRTVFEVFNSLESAPPSSYY